MKILLTGGGTGGHFYPIIAISQSLRKIIKEEKLLDATIYYMAPSPYNERALFENGIIYKYSFSGKIRRYFSILNIVDLFKTGLGVIKACYDVFSIFPDVVFGKGGYVSFPVLLAARIFGIPVVIHESDSVPGRVNLWAGKFAKRIAVSYPQAGKFFPSDRVAHTGNPIRKEIAIPLVDGARDFFGMDKDTPVVFILGGSQGSQKINEVIIDMLPELVTKCFVIHQTGKANFQEVSGTAQVVLRESQYISRYKPYAYLNDLTMRQASGVASVIISRAGSTIFEIASWERPSIIIPLPNDISHDQTSNAFAYSSSGACSVIEETNLTLHVLMSEIFRIIDNKSVSNVMIDNTKKFKNPDASDKIAREIINLALTHTQ